MKKALLTLGALLISATGAMATDGTASATVNYVTPVVITEQSGWTMTMTRKPGAAHMATGHYAQSPEWGAVYDKQPFDAQTAGCFKLAGDIGTVVSVSIAPPAGLTNGGNTLALDFSGTAKALGASGADCATAIAGTFSTNVIDGTNNTTLSGTGDSYIAWKISSLTGVTIPSDNGLAYTGTAVANVNYL